MDYPEMIYRCKDCVYLVEDEDGNWLCDDCGKKCVDIDILDCSAEIDW